MSYIVKQKLIGGRYGLREPLGRGGMSEVFLAHDEILKRDVALKIMKQQYAGHEGFVERFRREARSAASLNHPSTVHVYDWGRAEDDGAYHKACYMAMEYVPGGTLKDRILADAPLPSHTAVELASQIAQALQAAHRRGVVHRDVKPHNVLLTATGEAKVADFGIARAANASTTSKSGLILGTAGYMAPEQAKGEPVGPRSDLYSLGVVLYEMLTGEVPYKAEIPAVATGHPARSPRSPREANPEVPEEVDALTLRLLANDPGDRYGSAAELDKDLRRIKNTLPPAFVNTEAVAADLPVLPTPLTPANPRRGDGARGGSYVVYGRRFKKLPWTLAAFVALLVLLGVAAWDPLSGSQELAQAQDVALGSPLEWFGTAFEKGELATNSKEEATNAGRPPGHEDQEDPKVDSGGPKLADLAPGVAVLRIGDFVRDSKVGFAGEQGTGSEQVDTPEVSGRSAEETAQYPSEAGHPAADTTARRSTEPARTVASTDSSVGSTIEHRTATSTMLSSAPPSREVNNGREDAKKASVREETSTPKQPSKIRKRDKSPLEAVNGEKPRELAG